MLGVLSAEGAIFAALQTVRSVFLVLDRVVVPLLAFIASECNFNSCACSHSFGTSYFIYPRQPRALPPCMAERPVCGKKCAQKETSRATGKMYYSTCIPAGQAFFP
jgi:hypothetical protein